MLAGISTEYYLRLEQGRDRNPSAQVIDAIARVLQLDAEGTEHLLALAGPRPRRPGSRADRLPAGLDLLLRTVNVPAMVFNSYGDVLAANPLAQAVWPNMAPGTNRLRNLFTDHVRRSVDPDWTSDTAHAVAHLRAQIGTDTDDERLHALIDELSLESERFRQLWARHDVHTARGRNVVLHHSRVGDLELLVEKFAVIGERGLEVLLLHAEPDTPSADKLATLSDLVSAGN